MMMMTCKQLVLAGSENMHSAQKRCYVGANKPVNVTGQKSHSPGNTDDPRRGGPVPALAPQKPPMECFCTMASLLEKHEVKRMERRY